MTRGRLVGITAALVEVDFDVGLGAAVVAVKMLESGTKLVAVSVPVGFTVFVRAAELVTLSVAEVTAGVVVFAAMKGVSSGVVVGVTVGVIVGGVEITV
jgi:hypothetical protein